MLLVFIVIIIFVLIIVFKKNDINGNIQYNQDIQAKNLKNETMQNISFEDREKIIKKKLVDKFKVSEDQLSVHIARESDIYISGIFMIDKNFNLNNSNINNNSNNNTDNDDVDIEKEEGDNIDIGNFFAIIENDINIVWADNNIDCSVINKYNFPKEMAPTCF